MNTETTDQRSNDRYLKAVWRWSVMGTIIMDVADTQWTPDSTTYSLWVDKSSGLVQRVHKLLACQAPETRVICTWSTWREPKDLLAWFDLTRSANVEHRTLNKWVLAMNDGHLSRSDFIDLCIHDGVEDSL